MSFVSIYFRIPAATTFPKPLTGSTFARYLQSSGNADAGDLRFQIPNVLPQKALGDAMQRSTVLSLLSVVLLFGSPASARSAISNDGVLPVKLYEGYLIIVQGTLGDLEKRNLVIDTGAYPSIVGRDIAKKLHLFGHSEELRVAAHNLNSQAASLPHLRVGPIQVENLRMMVQNLTPLSLKFGARIDAVIGLDVLAHSSFRIDYGEKKMIFGSVDPLPFSAPLRWKTFMACVEIRVNDHPTHLLVDTGAANILLFSQRMPWLKGHSGRVRDATNLGGDFELREVTLDSLELAGVNLGPRDILVSDTLNMSPYPFDGLMATGELRQIAFDFEHQQFSWQPVKMRDDLLRAARGRVALPHSRGLTSPGPELGPAGALGRCAPDSPTGSSGVCAPAVQTGTPNSHHPQVAF